MESPDTAFVIHIQIGSSSHTENKVVGRDVVNKYGVRLAVFNDPFEPNWFVSNSSTLKSFDKTVINCH